MSSIAAHRRHPASIVLVLLLGLLVTGGLYAVLAPSTAGAATGSTSDIKAGKQLFLANCATCHGANGNGREANPSLVGVGAASVDFQVSTGRMPLAGPAVQAMRDPSGSQFTPDQISKLAAYVASLGPGPGIPSTKYTSLGGDVAKGGELFRVNCAMCHNVNGAGGALTRGKYAPSVMPATGPQIYEAMLTGPQSMPIFNDANLTPQDKKNVIAYINNVKTEPSQGGHPLGNLGPVTEGMFAWTIALGLFIGAAVWLGRKAA